MATMLIFKAVLLLGIASAGLATTRSKRELVPPTTSIVWSTSPRNPHGKRFVVPYSGNSAPYEDTSQIRSAANTIPWPGSIQTGIYSPYQFLEENIQSKNAQKDGQPREEVTQVPGAPPPLQGGFQASPEDGYLKNAPSHATQPSRNFRDQAANGGNQDSQYFANPSTYRKIPETDKKAQTMRKSSNSPVDGVSPKVQSFPAVPTDRQYPSTFNHSPLNPPKFPRFRGPSALTFGTQIPLANSPQTATLKSGTFLPIFSSGLSSSPDFKAFDKLAQNYLYGRSPAVAYSNMLPLPGHPLNGPPAPGFVLGFGTQQGLLGTGTNFQTGPTTGHNFEFSKVTPTSMSGSGPFSSLGTTQTAQYKSPIKAFASNEYAKPAGAYELLVNQPQLHFTTGAPPGINDDRRSVIYRTKPFEQIRTDVEVIDKKPTTQRPDYSDEHDPDEGLKTTGDFDYSRDDFDARPQKSPERGTRYKLPSSNLFDSYDEAFGKFSKLASHEQNSDRPRTQVQYDTKPVYQSIEDGGDVPRDGSSEDYRSGYTEAEAANGSYEDEDSQESRRSERQENDGPSSDAKEDDDDETIPYKSYGEDYEKEFEESYRKELPKNDYTHVKEVPDIEDAPSTSRKRSSSKDRAKSSRGGSNQKTRHVVRDDAEEPREYESYKSHRYEDRPKGSRRDTEGHGSNASWRTAGGTEAPLAESFGFKIPRDRGTSRYNNDNAESASTRDETTKSRKPVYKLESRFNKPSRQSPNAQKSMIGLALPAFESIASQAAPSNDDRKSDLKFFGSGDSVGAFSNPMSLRFLVKSQLGRDHSGI